MNNVIFYFVPSTTDLMDGIDYSQCDYPDYPVATAHRAAQLAKMREAEAAWGAAHDRYVRLGLHDPVTHRYGKPYVGRYDNITCNTSALADELHERGMHAARGTLLSMTILD